jgi:hypothetical protein
MARPSSSSPNGDTTDPASQQLRWIQPFLSERSYELWRDDDSIVATLRFEPKPAVTWAFADPQAARAEAGAEHWRFTVARRGLAGLLGARATIQVTGSHSARLDARSFLAEGILVFSDARRLHWKGKLIRGTRSAFMLDERTPLVSFGSGSPFQRVTARVEISPLGLLTPGWPLLASFGFYMRILTGRVWR